MTDVSEAPKSENQQGSAVGGIASVGALLRASRLRCGEELRDVAQTLRIRQRYLEAIEAGDISELPGQTYAIGFVRAYAEHLGLDGAEVVRRFKDGVTEAKEKEALVFPSPISESGIPGVAVLLVGLVVVALGYGIWYLNSGDGDVIGELIAPVPERLAEMTETTQAINTDQGAAATAVPAPKEPLVEEVPLEEVSVETPAAPVEEAPPEEVSVETPSAPVEETPAPEMLASETPAPEVLAETQANDVVVEAPEVSEPPIAAEDVTETASIAPPAAIEPAAENPSRIEIRARINSWIQVRDDTAGRLLFTRLLRAGDSYSVPGRTGLRLLTGNAGALEILVDGENVPAIGGEGQVRRDVALDPERLKQGTAVLDN